MRVRESGPAAFSLGTVCGGAHWRRSTLLRLQKAEFVPPTAAESSVKLSPASSTCTCRRAAACKPEVRGGCRHVLWRRVKESPQLLSCQPGSVEGAP